MEQSRFVEESSCKEESEEEGEPAVGVENGLENEVGLGLGEGTEEEGTGKGVGLAKPKPTRAKHRGKMQGGMDFKIS